MLRIKRSVQAKYNTDVGLVAAAGAGQGATGEANAGVDGGDPMASLERSAPLEGFVESTSGPVGSAIRKEPEKEEVEEDTPMANPDAIELGDDDEDEDMQED